MVESLVSRKCRDRRCRLFGERDSLVAACKQPPDSSESRDPCPARCVRGAELQRSVHIVSCGRRGGQRRTHDGITQRPSTRSAPWNHPRRPFLLRPENPVPGWQSACCVKSACFRPQNVDLWARFSYTLVVNKTDAAMARKSKDLAGEDGTVWLARRERSVSKGSPCRRSNQPRLARCSVWKLKRNSSCRMWKPAVGCR